MPRLNMSKSVKTNSNSLDHYFDDIKRYSNLTTDQEIYLGRIISGDNDLAYDLMINKDSFILSYFYANEEFKQSKNELFKQNYNSYEQTLSGLSDIADKVNLTRDFYCKEENNTRIFQSYLGMIANHLDQEPFWDNKSYLTNLTKEENNKFLAFIYDPFFRNKLKDNYETVAGESEIAKEEMINSNLRFVISIVNKIKFRTSYPFEDLIQEGNIGLINSVEKFDYQKGFRFSTYSNWWIKQSIRRSIDNNSTTIRVPAYKKDLMRKMDYIKSVTESSARGYSTNLFESLVSDYLELSLSKARKLIQLNKFTNLFSLDEKIGNSDNDKGMTLDDLIIGENIDYIECGLIQKDLELGISEVLDTLGGIEKEIIERRYGFNGYEVQSFQNIGEGFSLSAERIREIENKALDKLKSFNRKEMLKKLL